MIRLRAVTALLCATLTLSLTAAVPDDWTPLREEVTAEMKSLGVPGAAIAVAAGDRVVFAEGFGVADVKSGRAVTPDTRFRVGSVVKHFTAASIVTLARQQKLDLHAPMRTYLTDLPPKLGALTFDQLLSHRAGMVDRLNEPPLSDEDVFVEPGSIFSYSSPGYMLAGRAAAKAAGVTFEELVAQTLFTPQDMTATGYGTSQNDATGYEVRKGKKPRVAPLLSNPAARPAGMLFSNVNDLARYAIAFMNGGLPADVVAALSTERTKIPGDRRSYGYGTIFTDEHGDRAVFHMGDEYGGSAFLKMIPGKRVAVIVLTNSRTRMFKSMATALRLAGDVKTYEDPKEESTSLSRAESAELIGRYDNYQWLEVTRKGDRAVFGPWLPFWARWLPFKRELVKYRKDVYGIVGTPVSTEPLRFHVVRKPDGTIDYLMIMARAFKRRA